MAALSAGHAGRPARRPQPALADAAEHRWIGNYNNAPDGWPYELGYWVGQQIWQCYVAAAPDKHRAMHDVLTWNDPLEVLHRSGYTGQGCTVTAASPK